MPGPEIQISPTTSMEHGATSVTSSATIIVPTTAKLSRSVLIQNISTSAATCFIGRTGVTTATGIELVAGAHIVVDINQDAEALYGITASGTASVRWMAVS